MAHVAASVEVGSASLKTTAGTETSPISSGTPSAETIARTVKKPTDQPIAKPAEPPILKPDARADAKPPAKTAVKTTLSLIPLATEAAFAKLTSRRGEKKPRPEPLPPMSEPDSRPSGVATSISSSRPVPLPMNPPVTRPSNLASTRDQEISGIPSLKRKSRIFLSLRQVLQADSWEVSWVSQQEGVSCHNQAGDSLKIVPGNKRAFFNGTPVHSSVRPVLTKDGQLFVPIDLLNRVLDGRLSIIKSRASSQGLTIRLASKTSTESRRVPGVFAIRRQGQVMISLRQVLEADGWTVSWEGMKRGAVCRKGEAQILVVTPGKARSRLNDVPLRNRRAPVLLQERLLVTSGTLSHLLSCRIELLSFSREAHEAIIRISGG